MAICTICREIVAPMEITHIAVSSQMTAGALEAAACVKHIQDHHAESTQIINGAVTTLATWLALRHFTLNAQLQDENDRATERIQELVDSVRREQQAAADARITKLQVVARRHFEDPEDKHPVPGLPIVK